MSASFIQQLGQLLSQSENITKEMVQFFYFSVGYDETKHIISAEVAKVQGDLRSVLQDTLCLSGSPRETATETSVILLDKAVTLLKNAENKRLIENKMREETNLQTKEFDSLSELLGICWHQSLWIYNDTAHMI